MDINAQSWSPKGPDAGRVLAGPPVIVRALGNFDDTLFRASHIESNDDGRLSTGSCCSRDSLARPRSGCAPICLPESERTNRTNKSGTVTSSSSRQLENRELARFAIPSYKGANR